MEAKAMIANAGLYLHALRPLLQRRRSRKQTSRLGRLQCCGGLAACSVKKQLPFDLGLSTKEGGLGIPEIGAMEGNLPAVASERELENVRNALDTFFPSFLIST
eukprot:GHVT01038868.1.p7 GENE.GHVT01038868.1~~GHVT01038868.1.p7  ORF type:complete len:104 (-),score=22.44 GHVT01038868.1:2228-2539(-)